MRSYQVMLDGLRIACCESTGKGQPILFIHGNSLSGLCFRRQLESPLARQYRCIALDLPGHGRSAPAPNPADDYTLPGYAAVVTRLIEQLGLQRPILGGWSLGGHILLEAAGSISDAAGLVLFGTPPVGNPIAADAFQSHPAVQLFFKKQLTAEDVQNMAAACFCPGTQASSDVVEQITASDGRARELLGASIAAGNYTDEIAVVAGLNIPVAVMHGEKDRLISLPYLKRLPIPRLWRGEIQVIPDAGHAPHWEQPERFNSVLMQFIAENGC